MELYRDGTWRATRNFRGQGSNPRKRAHKSHSNKIRPSNATSQIHKYRKYCVEVLLTSLFSRPMILSTIYCHLREGEDIRAGAKPPESC